MKIKSRSIFRRITLLMLPIFGLIQMVFLPNFISELRAQTEYGRMINMSTNAILPPSGNLDAGMILFANTPREMVFFAENVSGMINPFLEIIDITLPESPEIVASNDDWQDDPRSAEVEQVRMPNTPSDAALAVTLTQGIYLARLRNRNGSDQGQGNVQINDVSPDPENGYLLNQSTNALVPMDAGLIVESSDGSARDFILYGEEVNGMVNPVLEVITPSNNQVIAFNDDWEDDLNASVVEQLRAPLQSTDAALAITLAPGTYIVRLRNSDGSRTGQGNVQMNDMTPP